MCINPANKAFKRIRNSLLGSASLHILASYYSPLNAALYASKSCNGEVPKWK